MRGQSPDCQGVQARWASWGACVSDYPVDRRPHEDARESWVEVSISSLRADSLTEDLVASLQRERAPDTHHGAEADTERLRRVIRKVITDEQLCDACHLLRHAAYRTQVLLHDRPCRPRPWRTWRLSRIWHAAARSACACRARTAHLRKLTYPCPSFVPEAVDASMGALRRPPRPRGPSSTAIKARRPAARRSGGAREPAQAALQALLARGDRRVADFLEIAAGLRRRPAPSASRVGRRPRFFTRRQSPRGEAVPWDHFDVG